MASWLECSTADRVVQVRFQPGTLCHGQDTLLSWCLSPPRCIPAKMLGVTLRWTSIPSRGSRNIPSRFMLRKPEISAGLMGLSRLVTETLPF